MKHFTGEIFSMIPKFYVAYSFTMIKVIEYKLILKIFNIFHVAQITMLTLVFLPWRSLVYNKGFRYIKIVIN